MMTKSKYLKHKLCFLALLIGGVTSAFSQNTPGVLFYGTFYPTGSTISIECTSFSSIQFAVGYSSSSGWQGSGLAQSTGVPSGWSIVSSSNCGNNGWCGAFNFSTTFSTGGLLKFKILREVGTGQTDNIEITITRPTGSSAFITGSNPLCSGQTTYTLNNPPTGLSWTWSSSSNLSINGSTSNSTASVSYGSSGAGFVKVNWTQQNCPVEKAFNLQVGTYTQSQMQPITGPTSPCMGVQSTYYSPYLSANNADYDWQISSPWQFNTYKDASAFYVTPYYQTFAQISLKVRNACGWPSIPALLSINTANCGSYRYGAGPNPVKGKLTVTASWEAKQAGTMVFKGASKLPDYTTKLYDEKGALYYEGTTDTPTVEIDMRTYPKGVYYLHLGSGNTWEKIRVVKE